MPECYTHVYLASEALMRSGNTVASRPAMIAGANGPDPLYNYHIWRRKRKPDLPKLADKMHHIHTGAFLRALVRCATSPIQQSFTLGFIVHYAVDCTLNPWFDAMSAKGMPYAGRNGRWRMGADLDAALYFRDYHSRRVPLHAGTPVLITDELAQVGTLLREAVEEVYGQRLPLLALADAYHDNTRVRRLLLSRVWRPFLGLWQRGRPEKCGGPFSARRQPGWPLPHLPQHWVNPHSGAEMDLTMDEILALAEQTGAICVTAAMRWWLGELSDEKLATVLGDNDYLTGLPCEKPEDKPTEPAAHTGTAQEEEGERPA